MERGKRRKSTTETEVLLALDLSLSSTGWAVIEYGNGGARLIACGEIKTDAKQSHGQRLRNIRAELEQLKETYKFAGVCKERGFSRFPKETQALYKAHGITEEYFADFPVEEYAPASVKKAITGNGRATKKDVEQGVRELLGLPETYKFSTDDASDAVAVGLTHLIKTKRLKGV